LGSLSLLPHDGEAVSPQLRPLLENVYLSVLSNPPELYRLKKRLEELLVMTAF